MLTTTALHSNTPIPAPPALPDNRNWDALESTTSGRSGGVVPSQGLEWSFFALAIGVLGLIFLFFKVMNTPVDSTPQYERQSRIAPLEVRPRTTENQVDLGVPTVDNGK